MQGHTSDAVLFVDDEWEILQALKRRFRKEPFTLYTAGSGQEALDILESNPVQLIISDARMAGMDGIQLLEQVKQRYPDIVRMIFSGYVETEGLMDAINKGEVLRFITKPWASLIDFSFCPSERLIASSISAWE